MYRLLVVAMVIGALGDLKLEPSDFKKCSSRQRVQTLSEASHKVSKIKWKPISIFPDEAKRFLDR